MNESIVHQTLQTLQLFYAGLLADSVANYAHFGVLEAVAEKKAREQALAAPAQLVRLGIGSPRELFERFAAIFGCARWQVRDGEEGETVAETGSCLACVIARKRGAPAPCALYCIQPFRAYASTFQPALRLEVDETLWEGGRCRFRMVRAE